MKNSKSVLDNVKKVHMIGIGGSGMYPLAQILHTKGYIISGSDNNETDTLEAVRSMGITVYMGQKGENIAEDVEMVVYSAAIAATNPELVAARTMGIPVLERSELLGIVSSWYDMAICVSGTHGKTTTTSMLTQIHYTAGTDLSAVIGGKLPCIHGSGRAGESEVFLCESCEFVDTFLKLYPDIAVILNIDEDHLDYFKNLDNIIASFRKFAQRAEKAVLFNGDDANTLRCVDGLDKKLISFGYGESNEWRASDVVINGLRTDFKVWHNQDFVGDFSLYVPGKHNVLNALSAIAASVISGVEISAIQKGLSDFRGAKRRFEVIYEEKGITIADDYAHHPTEIAGILNAAKTLGYKRIWAVHQPFTFSRTSILLDDFAQALSIADIPVLTDIMGGREENTYGIYTRDLAEKMENCVWFPQDETAVYTDERKYQNFDEVADYVATHAESGDLIITLGCGDVNKLAKLIAKKIG